LSEIEPKDYIYVSEKHGIARIKKEILKEIGTYKIPYVIDANTVLLYDPTKSAEEILKSIDVLKGDILVRIRKAEEDKKYE